MVMRNAGATAPMDGGRQRLRRSNKSNSNRRSLLTVALASAFLSATVLQGHFVACGAFWSSAQTEDGEVEDLGFGGSSLGKASDDVPVEYGVDVSFPIHHETASTNYAWLKHNLKPGVASVPKKYKGMPVQPLGDRQAFYQDFVDGCVKHFGSKGKRCIETEHDRVEMSLRQPQSMQNYTEMGFKKIKAPEKVFSLIKEFWDKNKDNAKVEQWGTANTYTNNWASPSYMVSVEDNSLRGGGGALKRRIWNAARETIQEWTGEELTECSLYGIRVYKEGAVLSTHVDRLPLVSSAIINVAQDLDEPWPLEVYSHEGKAVNVTMEPGDMVLYESHSVLHGRPFPLKGRFMANVFIHFEPTGHSLRHTKSMMGKDHGDVHAKYRDATKRGVGGHEADSTGLPPYIIPGTPEDSYWRRQHPGGYKPTAPAKTLAITGSTAAHQAAQAGLLDELQKEVKKKKDIVNAKDANGWTPLHEGARAGHLEVVKFLIESGADANATTHGGGGTVLWWAKQTHEADHPVIQFLEELGALESGPEL